MAALAPLKFYLLSHTSPSAVDAGLPRMTAKQVARILSMAAGGLFSVQFHEGAR